MPFTGTPNFPETDDRRRRLPAPQDYPLTALDSTPSYGSVGVQVTVPPFDEQNPDDRFDEHGFVPVMAVYVCAAPVWVDGHPVFINTGLSRCSVKLDRVTVQPATPGTTVFPQTVDFAVRAVISNGAPYTAWVGTVAVPTKGVGTGGTPAAPLAFVSGVLCTQFEVWARVLADEDHPNAQPVQVRVEMLVDRLGDAFKAQAGDIAGGDPLPPPAAPV